MTIIAGPVKRSIMARIAGLDLTNGDLGDSVDVHATIPPEPDRKCVYGGRVQWVQRDRLAERTARVFEQTVTFEVRVRVTEPGDDIDGVEKEAERIVAAIAAGVVAEPSLVGPAGRIVATSGDADPTALAPGPEPSVTANLGLTFTVSAVVVGA